MHYTIANDMSLLLGPTPSDVYRVRGEYHKSAVELSADSDTPIYPAEYHMLPVYAAMFRYAGFTAASEVVFHWHAYVQAVAGPHGAHAAAPNQPLHPLT